MSTMKRTTAGRPGWRFAAALLGSILFLSVAHAQDQEEEPLLSRPFDEARPGAREAESSAAPSTSASPASMTGKHVGEYGDSAWSEANFSDIPAGVPSARVLVTSRHSAKVASQLAGVVESIVFDAGDSFEKGDVLARMDCRMIRAERDVAATELRAAKTRLSNKEELVKRGSASLMDVDLAALDLDKAKAYLQVADVRLSLCAIRAPFDGVVRERLVAEHEFVSAGTPTVDIVDTGALEVEAVVPSAWLSWIGKGTAMSVAIDETGEHLEAVVSRVEPHIDPVSQSVRIWGRIERSRSDAALLPGMSGLATFVPGS